MKRLFTFAAVCLAAAFAAGDPPLAVTTNVTVFSLSGTWVCPAGVSLVQVECWGGGGAGGSASRNVSSGSAQYGGGGAGGAYARYNSYTVIPGNTYYVHVGEGGANTSAVNRTTVAGGDTWFNSVNSPSTVILAKGGAGGASAIGNTQTTAFGPGGVGTSAGSIGNVVHAGGSGATGATSAAGGGGSSAGPGGAGNSTTSNIGAVAPEGGGSGGTGPTTTGANGGTGYPPPGGGGSGARDASGLTTYVRSGGFGADGQVRLTYTTLEPQTAATAAMPTGDGSGSDGLTTYAERTLIVLTEIPSAGTGPFTYAWKKVGSNTVLGTNSTLVVYYPVNGDQYTCDVAAIWDGVVSTSPAATLTVNTVHDPAKVVFMKADDFIVPSEGPGDFIQVSRDMGINVCIGFVVNQIDGIAASKQWMQQQQAVGGIEFWNHGWDHYRWWDANGNEIGEFEGSGLAYMREHMAYAQTGLKAASGRDTITFGPPYNGFDADCATVINETPELRILFTHRVAQARSLLSPRVTPVLIISESVAVGMPDAELFKEEFPPGTPGPVSLQLHPSNSNFNQARMDEYKKIVHYLLTNGYTIMTTAEFVEPVSLIAAFRASSTNGAAPLTVTFTDISSTAGQITNRFWNFGDGTTTNTTAISLTHTYTSISTNSVTLVVSDATGSSTNTKSNFVTTFYEPPRIATNFTTSGTWICPEGVTNIKVECWGGGGAGGSAIRPSAGSTQYGGGGAGGAYARYNSYPVIPGNTYYINVGKGGDNSSDVNDTTVSGSDSWFNSVNQPSTIIIAKGGAGGQSAIGNTTTTAYGTGGTGTTGGSTGDVVYAGGSGAAGASSAAGGGGSSAGTSRNGTSASSNVGAAAPDGGGGGGTGPTTSSGVGAPGYAPGGGGSGARDGYGTLRPGGSGGSGQVSVSYINTLPSISATASSPTGNGSGFGGLTTYAQRTRITLTETPSAGTGPFTYAWKKVGSDTVLGTNTTLVVSPPVNGDQYTCDVAAIWDGVINTSPAATVTVTTVINPEKVAMIKADAFRALGSSWDNFIAASRALGINVSIGPICTNNISPDYAVSNPAAYQSTTNWMQTQQAVGDVEFWEYAWTHTTWLDTNGNTVYEYKGSGLEFQQANLAKSQAALSNAIGRNAVAFGPAFNQVDMDTATIINDTPALKLLFVANAGTAQSIGLDPRVATAVIFNETNYGDGVGKPNAEVFKAAFPSGPPGPAALQFHPSDGNFNADRLIQYQQIVQHLLTNGYVFLLPSEYVASMPVYASFSASPTNGGAPLTVTFIDSSLGTPTNRFWNFGDGSTANVTADRLTHTYSSPGTHTVQLIVHDTNGASTITRSGLIVASSVDTVGDGVPDWWRARYFGGNGRVTSVNSGATADPDDDGRNNHDEYLADTDPANAASRLAVIRCTVVTNGVSLIWTGGSNAWQSIEYCNSLMDTNGWKAVCTNTPPTAVTNTLFDPGAGAATNRFYRIRAWR